ncbi:DNA-binding protein, YbaB/EbfC family [Geotalea daltonii FRC-32]|uniref:Nucleoid-associated protein Geob_0377 n=1 Tax=Geotalea daltonii (strain DSM 22248 / JCM 15807 / FRC-32) TaxID=316067 RepID=B9LZ14_GEODF|nr:MULTISPECIES: YbaB/EbfC family nucleoid-associated protein [Geotalea]ACM18746.1 DNA-binding protein, YbaB/EbfC family [Geotalea daltonii FRC-32]
MSKGLASIMKQAQMMQQKMGKLQEEASQKTVEATAGGGAVTAVVNGKNQLLALTIKKEAVDPEDVEMLQDLVVAAVNEALTKVQSEMAEQMSKITGGINIPGLF